MYNQMEGNDKGAGAAGKGQTTMRGEQARLQVTSMWSTKGQDHKVR